MAETMKWRSPLMATLLAWGSIAATGVATAQAVGTVRPFSQNERTQGAEAHQQIMREFGDAYAGRQADYVRSVGQNVAVHTGLSTARTDYTVTLLNSPVNNAFAVPGGYVYVTRQLMALMNNEAELGGVLGHEYAHTALRHARDRQRAARNATLGGLLGTVLGGVLGDNGGLLGGLGGLLRDNSMQVAQGFTLRFSRSQETQSDDYGMRYLRLAGYDPLAMSTVLASLAAQTQLEQRVAGLPARSIPEWASTHPDPASRVQRAANGARALGATGGRVNRDQFITALDGMLYGDDPRQGVVEGRTFQHPDLRLMFAIPPGFGMQNGTSAVTVSGQGGQAQFTMGQYNGDMDAYVRSVFQGLASQGNRQGQQPAQIPNVEVRRTTVNGIPVAYATTRANNGQQQVDVTVFAYEFARDRAYHFVALTQAGGSAVFEPMFNSVRRLTPSEAAAIRPRRLSIVTVRRGDTVQSLAGRMAYSDYQLDRFLVLNGLSSNATLTPGQRVKIVVYGS
jgi:predicted Zn-dependent protease